MMDCRMYNYKRHWGMWNDLAKELEESEGYAPDIEHLKDKWFEGYSYFNLLTQYASCFLCFEHRKRGTTFFQVVCQRCPLNEQCAGNIFSWYNFSDSYDQFLTSLEEDLEDDLLKLDCLNDPEKRTYIDNYNQQKMSEVIQHEHQLMKHNSNRAHYARKVRDIVLPYFMKWQNRYMWE